MNRGRHSRDAVSKLHRPDKKKTVEILGSIMAYVESGVGDPVILIHGNPTSSFLWRHVIPEIRYQARCIAIDLVGMGDSAKVGTGPRSYRFLDHRTYLDAFLEVLEIGSEVILVGHDWGGVLAFDWANHHRSQVKGIAYLETVVAPLTWDDWPPSARPIFQALRSEAGEEMVLNRNIFVERILPASVLNPLSASVMDEYRRPFKASGEGRRPTLTWPRELPIDGTPEAVAQIVADYAGWMATNQIPKLFINGDPGSILVGRQRQFCRGWPNQIEVTVPGIHFLPEDSGTAIGKAISGWIDRLPARSPR